MGKTTSETKTERSLVDNLIGTEHYVTTIKDDKDKVAARGSTPEQAEERASKKWEDKNSK